MNERPALVNKAAKFLTPALLTATLFGGNANADTHEVANLGLESLKLYTKANFGGTKMKMPITGNGCVPLSQPFVARSADNMSTYRVGLYTNKDCAYSATVYLSGQAHPTDFRRDIHVASVSFYKP